MSEFCNLGGGKWRGHEPLVRYPQRRIVVLELVRGSHILIISPLHSQLMVFPPNLWVASHFSDGLLRLMTPKHFLKISITLMEPFLPQPPVELHKAIIYEQGEWSDEKGQHDD